MDYSTPGLPVHHQLLELQVTDGETPWEASAPDTAGTRDSTRTVLVKEKGRERSGERAWGTDVPCEDPRRNNNGGVQATLASSLRGEGPAPSLAHQTRARPADGLARRGQWRAADPPESGSAGNLWEGGSAPRVTFQGLGGQVQGPTGDTCEWLAWLSQHMPLRWVSVPPSIGEPLGGPQIPQDGDLLLETSWHCPHLLHQRQWWTERSTQEEHSGEHSVGGLKRRTQEEHLQGTLRGSTQEGHSGGCPLSSPATLSWALRASSPASEFDGLDPFDRPTDGPCMSCPPWRPCNPIAQQRQVTSPQGLARREPALPGLSRLSPRLEGQWASGPRRPSGQEHRPEMSQPSLWPHGACGHCLLLHCCPASPRSNPRVSEQRRACAGGGLSSPGRN